MSATPQPGLDHELEIPRRAESGPAPLSFAQELLWLMDLASPGLTAWNAPRAFRLKGPLDETALQSALDAVVARHAVLRTVFTGPETAPRQVVEPATSLPIERVDLTAAAADRRSAELGQLVRAHARRRFDLSRDHLLSALLLTLGADDHVLCLNSHHIVFDGWSRSVLVREISALYEAARRGVAAELPALPIQYADYASWERDPRHEAALATSLAYWRDQLSGPLPALELPTDRPRQAVRSFEGERCTLVLPPSLVAAVNALARDQDVTLYMALLAAYVTLLHRYTGQDDIVVGSPIAGRMQHETEGLIGFFANTLVLRNRLSPDSTFAELLAQVRETALGAYEHQEVPFERLVLELQKGKQLTHAPLFQVVLTMEDTVPATLQFDHIEVETLGVELGAAKFDLTLMVAQQPDGLRLALWYRTDLHRPETADRILGHLRAILEAAVEDPMRRIRDLPLMSAAEERAVVAESVAASVAVDQTPVYQQFMAAAQRTPHAAAVTSGTHTLTYSELDQLTSQVAHRLCALGVIRGAAIGLCTDRSVDAIVGMLGIMKAGAAYVPLAPELPPARIAQQVDEAGVLLAVTTSVHRNRLPTTLATLSLDADADAIAAESAPALAPGATPADPAYVLFTSGSTGVPKGVAVTHANLAHYTSAITHRLGLGEAPDGPLNFATVSTLAADLGNTAIFPALTTGGTLHVIPADIATDAARFGDYAVAQPIDVLKITPNHLRALLSGPHGDAVLPCRWLVLGGEACSWELAERLLRVGKCRVLNHYGPTEATVGCCTFEVTADGVRAARDAAAETVPIGRPLPNVAAYVVDPCGRLAPPGVAGELWIGGAGVASGYVNRPDLTKERFSADPFRAPSGARMYHTGDRARRLATGDLEFLGRTDDQVKVRGYRVEPGEIEQVLTSHSGVAQAVAIVRTDSAEGEPALVAYVVLKTAGYAAAHAERPTPERLLALVAERLPDYMVPSALLIVEKLPLGANGKLDRAALPAPESTEPGEHTIAPRTKTESALVQIWTDVLKRDRIGITDNFLALGGHSLLAIRVLGRISKQLGVRLPLRTLFEAPTVAELAVRLEAELHAKEQEMLRALTDIEQMSNADVQRKLAEDAPSGPA
jgi:amino acid adenylation domain-containing protein